MLFDSRNSRVLEGKKRSLVILFHQWNCGFLVYIYSGKWIAIVRVLASFFNQLALRASWCRDEITKLLFSFSLSLLPLRACPNLIALRESGRYCGGKGWVCIVVRIGRQSPASRPTLRVRLVSCVRERSQSQTVFLTCRTT